MKTATVLAAAACLMTLSGAQAQDKLKIGFIATLSGPPAVLGTQLKNGFLMGIKDLGGKLGGREVDVIVQDDELKPDVAVSKVKAFVERDKVDFVVGPIFSNVLQAIMKAPNYQAGKDSLAGFKNYFKGTVVDEVYVPLNQLDYSAELSKIAAAQPEAVFVFLPGGMGVNFVKQFRQAGLADKVKFLSAFTVDEGTLPAQQDAALGFFGGSNWAPNLDNPQNKAFVDAYVKEYNAVPASYAFQSYDAALLIDSALKATGGKTDNKDALRAALKKADFKSLRGKFRFNTNHYPIQDFYLVKVAKRADGKYQTEIAQKVFTDYADPHVKDCPMK